MNTDLTPEDFARINFRSGHCPKCGGMLEVVTSTIEDNGSRQVSTVQMKMGVMRPELYMDTLELRCAGCKRHQLLRVLENTFRGY